MDLFNPNNRNILPYDGEVEYWGKLLDADQAYFYLHNLLEEIEWKNDEAILFGKRIVTKRKVAWYGDKPYAYTYSNTTKEALPWTANLLNLKALVEERSKLTFNSCLLNLYHTGEEGMAWHSDDEKMLEKHGGIASLSFGATRKFAFKHKRTAEKTSIVLEPGSLLLMKGDTQTHWLHRLPPTKMVKTPRVNLTFRTILE
jgi:alkylated DNA repair dioxygenase AlkB